MRRLEARHTPTRHVAEPRRASLRLLHSLPIFLALVIVAPLLLASAAAQADEPRVLASTYRVDLGSMVPGESRGGSIMLSNPTYEPVVVRFRQTGEPILLHLAVENLTLQPGESAPLSYTYTTSLEAPPGNHGEALRLVPGKELAAPGELTLDAGTAIIFTSRTTSIGIAAIEAPARMLPNATLSGRVLLVNTWNASVSTAANITWRDPAKNTTFANLTLGPVIIPAGGSAFVPFAFVNTTPTPGSHLIRATIVVDHGTPITTKAFEAGVHVGRREASYRVMSTQDLRDGNATITMEFSNTGDVPVTLHPRIALRPIGVNTTDLVVLRLDPMTLEPGETRMASITTLAPPGRFSIVVDDEELESEAFRADIAEEDLIFHMAVPIAPSEPLWGRMAPFVIPLGWAFLGLGIAAALVRYTYPRRAVMLERARRARGAIAYRMRRRPATVPVDVPDEELDAFLMGFEEGPRPIVAPPALPTQPAGSEQPALAAELAPLAEEPPPVRAIPPHLRPVTAARPAPASLPRARETVVLVDTTGLGQEGVDRVRRAVDGASLVAVYAYAIAESHERSATLYAELRAAGFSPRVRVHPRAPGSPQDLRVEFTIEALAEARRGRAVVLATHDAAFAPLVQAMREEGVHVSILGDAGRIPVVLRDAASAVHELPY